jgi:serine phosphatase RsbU (regulator of sigma subunit)
MNQSAEAIAQAICASVQQFQGDRVERDDVTLVVLKLS